MITIAVFFSILIATLASSAIPGPTMFLVVSYGLSSNFEKLCSFILGLAIIDIFYMTVAYYTSNNMFANVDSTLLSWVTTGVLVVFGLYYLFRTKHEQSVANPKVKNGVLGSFLLGLIMNGIDFLFLAYWIFLVELIKTNIGWNDSSLAFFLYVFAVIVGNYSIYMFVYYVTDKRKRSLSDKFIANIHTAIGLLLLSAGFANLIF